MKKQILVDNKTKAFLRKTFNCSSTQVWRALNFERNSKDAVRMRMLALQRGGKLTEGYIPNCDTEYNTAEGIQTQTFGKRVKIVADRKSGEVKVWIDGKQEGETYRNLSIPDFMQLQHEVEQMAAAL